MERSNAPNHLVGTFVGDNRIELVSLIGEGAYGCVYRGVVGKGALQKQYAVKCMSRTGLDKFHLMIQRREVLLHQLVSDGDGIVSLYETFEEDDCQFLVMELCTEGDLWEAISTGRYARKDDLVRDIFTQILDAVEYIHSKRVFHRDLKPENILLADGGRRVLLADFGLASCSVISREMRCGSPWYLSPECWGIDTLNRPYAPPPNDVWALGILFINVACGRHAPWKEATSKDTFFRDFVRQPGMLRFFLPMSSEAHDLLERVFDVNPATRISVGGFKRAVREMKTLTIPTAKHRAFRENQEAWINAVRPSPSRHPLSIDTLHIIPIASRHVAPRVSDDIEGTDITEYAATPYFAPFLLPPSSASMSPKPSDSFICNIPIVDTSKRRAALSSASSAAESVGPITPAMRPTAVDIAVPDLQVVDSESQDLADARLHDDVADTPTMHAKGTIMPLVVVQPLRSILEAVTDAAC